MEKVCLVVPTIREESFRRFIQEWGPTGLFDRVDLCLVEDNPERTFSLPEVFKTAGCKQPDWKFGRTIRMKDGSEHFEIGSLNHFCWKDIDEQLGDKSWIIPRRSDTVRSFGYWWAWKQKAYSAHSPSYGFVQTLDDDCYPEPGYEKLDEIHESLLTRTKWFNTLNNVRPRGTPYKNLGTRDVMVNHGLWTNVLDYDAPQQLVNPIEEKFSHDNRIVPHGSFFSLCGMNVFWRRDTTPLMYHMLMGNTIDREGRLTSLGLDRFGDIFAGIVMKRISDHLGWIVSSGVPYIHHDRASDPFKNLVKEAAGIGLNETFWERIDAIPLTGNGPIDCYRQIGIAVSHWDGEWQWYWEKLGRAMQLWAGLFEETV